MASDGTGNARPDSTDPLYCAGDRSRKTSVWSASTQTPTEMQQEVVKEHIWKGEQL